MDNLYPTQAWQAQRRVYQRHETRLNARLAEFASLDRRFVRLRLGMLTLILAAGAFTIQSGALWPGMAGLVVTLVVFIGTVYYHRRLDRMTLRFQIARQLTGAQRARLDLDWENLPPASLATLKEDHSDHPYANDLDIQGERSLQRLLDASLSTGGSLKLRGWLLDTSPDPAAIQRRQRQVRALLPRRSFRRQLALRGALAAGGIHNRWDGEALLSWLRERVPDRSGGRYLALLSLLAAANWILLGLYLAGVLPPLWLGTTLVYGSLLMYKQRETQVVFEQAATLQDTLLQIQAVLSFLESNRFPAAPELADLGRTVRAVERRPSRQLRQLNLLLSAAGLRLNPFAALFLNALLPWDYLLLFAFNRLKAGLLRRLPEWLESWYALEALNSLANFAQLNPEYTFPTIYMSVHRRPVLSVRGIGHPLISYPTRRCNTFSLDSPGDIALISGSNMSGKSTFLRTLGINLCLAFAGAPVAGEAFETIPWRIFSSMQINDSLQNGISFFYAEVKRLKALLDAYQQNEGWPVFFLIDEIFRGTNNRERRLGSQAYVESLAKGSGAGHTSGAGCIATHDLELVGLAENIPGVHNYHFREQIQDSRMVFDYLLRPGPCPTTNALEIMRLEGLPTPDLKIHTPLN